MNDLSAAPWQEAIFEAMRSAEIRQVPYVPDAGHAHLIRRIDADPEMRGIVLTTEEEGIAVACGAWLGGQKSVLLMQSSGVGNCINTLSLPENGRFPLVLLITMRGEFGEFNSWQVPMARAVEPCLAAMGIAVQRCDTPDAVGPTVSAALYAAYSSDQRVAILLGQKLIGRKEW